MIVMKFGGTSVADSSAINRAISIIESRLEQQPVVVVSAMSKVTDALTRISAAARAQDERATAALLEQLRSRHIAVASELLHSRAHYLMEAISEVNTICDYLDKVVTAVCAIGELSARSEAIILSHGEILSSTIIHYALCARGIDTARVDARQLIVTAGPTLKAEPLFDEIARRVPEVIGVAMQGRQAVITQGFIAATADGEPTVLGRGGSDYTASLLGMALGATCIEIWTDVDGVRTADPRLVPDTQCLSRISYEEAAEMAHFGAKVLHPLTIEPAIIKGIPLCVLNSLNPEHPGSAIMPGDKIADGAKAVSWKENIVLVNVFSPHMINASGFSQKVFEVFARYGISVDLISTSEANISVTIDGLVDITQAVSDLSGFAQVKVYTDKSQVSVIGKNIINHDCMIQLVAEALRGYRIYMVSQGAAFINFSFVVDRDKLAPIVTSLHNRLFL